MQIEEGATATAYHPFQYTAIDLYARELTLGLGLFGDLNVLSANDDLDNISNGVWVAQTTAIANTILNKPVNVTTFKIISFQLNGTAQVQIVIGQNDQLYYRTQKGDGTYNDWRNASDLLQFLSLSSYTKITTYGTDIAPALSSMTGTGTATFDTDKWVFSEGGSIYADISVTKDETYLVSLTIDSIVVTNGDINVSPATISIGTESIDIFSAADANWNVVLTAQTSGTVRFTFSTLSAWAGNVTGLSIKPIANRATKPLEINSLPVNCYNSNVSLGGQNNILYGGSGANAGGRQNAAYGWNCQRDINTGKWNSAFGYNTQLKLTQGIGNSAFGTWAQNALTTGCYNNAFGESAQNHMVDGMWNDAHGIEAQGMATTAKNNVAMGRRSQHLLTTGNFNTAVGAWSGFNSHDVSPEGKNAVKTSNYTTLVGGASTLLSADAGDSDYATALGYQTKVAKQGLALGALSTADENGIAIGHNVSASTDEIVIGNSDQTVTIAGKTIVFNNDGSVSWS